MRFTSSVFALASMIALSACSASNADGVGGVSGGLLAERRLGTVVAVERYFNLDWANCEKVLFVQPLNGTNATVCQVSLNPKKEGDVLPDSNRGHAKTFEGLPVHDANGNVLGDRVARIRIRPTTRGYIFEAMHSAANGQMGDVGVTAADAKILFEQTRTLLNGKIRAVVHTIE